MGGLCNIHINAKRFGIARGDCNLIFSAKAAPCRDCALALIVDPPFSVVRPTCIFERSGGGCWEFEGMNVLLSIAAILKLLHTPD